MKRPDFHYLSVCDMLASKAVHEAIVECGGQLEFHRNPMFDFPGPLNKLLHKPTQKGKLA